MEVVVEEVQPCLRVITQHWVQEVVHYLVVREEVTEVVFIVLVSLTVLVEVFQVLIHKVLVELKVHQAHHQHQVVQEQVDFQTQDVVMVGVVAVRIHKEVTVQVQMVVMVVPPEAVVVVAVRVIRLFRVKVVMEVQEVEEKLEYILGKKNIIWQ